MIDHLKNLIETSHHIHVLQNGHLLIQLSVPDEGEVVWRLIVIEQKSFKDPNFKCLFIFSSIINCEQMQEENPFADNCYQWNIINSSSVPINDSVSREKKIDDQVLKFLTRGSLADLEAHHYCQKEQEMERCSLDDHKYGSLELIPNFTPPVDVGIKNDFSTNHDVFCNTTKRVNDQPCSQKHSSNSSSNYPLQIAISADRYSQKAEAIQSETNQLPLIRTCEIQVKVSRNTGIQQNSGIQKTQKIPSVDLVRLSISNIYHNKLRIYRENSKNQDDRQEDNEDSDDSEHSDDRDYRQDGEDREDTIYREDSHRDDRIDRQEGKVREEGEEGEEEEEEEEEGARKGRKVRKVRKDRWKNMYGSSFKFIVKQFLSEKYRRLFDRVCWKFGVFNRQAVRDFYYQKIRWSISLNDLHSFLNFDDYGNGQSQRRAKQAFHAFYVWYMRNKYTLHILTEDKITHKDNYLQAKNWVVYLPSIRPQQKSRRNSSPKRRV